MTSHRDLDALRAHAQCSKMLSEARNMSDERLEAEFPHHDSQSYIWSMEDAVKKWFAIYTDPMGKGAYWLNKDVIAARREAQKSPLQKLMESGDEAKMIEAGFMPTGGV